MKQDRAERRRNGGKRRAWYQRPMVVVGFAGVCIVAIFGLVLVLGNPSNTPTYPLALSESVLHVVTSPDPLVLDRVQTGGLQDTLSKLPPAAVLQTGGKPSIVYEGAEYCPFCAAERWPMVIALSRFGTWTGLQGTVSADADAYPDTNTLALRSATFTSQYLTFSSTEVQDRNRQPLQTLTPQVSQLVNTWDVTPYSASKGGIPFLDIGGQYLLNQPGYSPQDLQGSNWDAIANYLADPTSKVAKDILGHANYLTAAICETTQQQPSAVCADPVIVAIEQQLPTTPPKS